MSSVDLHCSYQLERLAVANGGNILTGTIVALAVELTAIATKDAPAAQAKSATPEDLQVLAECAFLPCSA